MTPVEGETRSMYPGGDPENGPRCRHVWREEIGAWLDPYADREFLEARRCGPHVPFNLALHDHMMTLGYEWTRIPDSWEDDGDGESGPHLTGGPACDQYAGPDEYVYCAFEGRVLDRQARDLEYEAWCDGQIEASNTHGRL